jgi:hypothetical protein
MAWFIDRDGGEESSVALFCIQKVQCLGMVIGEDLQLDLKN